MSITGPRRTADSFIGETHGLYTCIAARWLPGSSGLPPAWILRIRCRNCGFEREVPANTWRGLRGTRCYNCVPRRFTEDDRPSRKDRPIAALRAAGYEPEGMSPVHLRIHKLWSRLKKQDLCPAWRTFEKFLFWAERNGYRTGSRLVRNDLTKPFHPYNVHWEHLK